MIPVANRFENKVSAAKMVKEENHLFNAKQIPNELTFNTSTYIAPYFNLFYYTALVPFKTVPDVITNSYVLKTNTLQQVSY